jgi:hypothetical protein
MCLLDIKQFIIFFSIFIFMIYITMPKYNIIFKYKVSTDEEMEHVRSESIECPK